MEYYCNYPFKILSCATITIELMIRINIVLEFITMLQNTKRLLLFARANLYHFETCQSIKASALHFPTAKCLCYLRTSPSACVCMNSVLTSYHSSVNNLSTLYTVHSVWHFTIPQLIVKTSGGKRNNNNHFNSK